MGPERFKRLAEVLDQRQPDLTVLMERVNKVHNVSAIVRTCDAAGIMRVHAVPPDAGMPIPHHTSAGSKKWVEVVEHPDLTSATDALRGGGMQILAANLSPEAMDYRTVDLTRPTAFLVGAELDGVSAEGLLHADHEIVIPMAGMVQSLNVSVATALLVFEAVRQRHQAGMFDRCSLPASERARILFEWAYPRVADRLRCRGIPYPPLDETGAIPGHFTAAIREARATETRNTDLTDEDPRASD